MASLHWVGAAALVLVVGCPSPVEGDSATGGGSDASTGEASTSGASTSDGSLSMTGASASMTSVGTSASTSASEDSGSGPATSTTTSASSGSADVTTSVGDPCAGLSREECVAEGCTAIACQPFVTDGAAGTICIGGPEFIGCRSSDLGCDDVRTTTCEGDDATVYVCTDSCIPEGWIECMAPGMMIPPCP